MNAENSDFIVEAHDLLDLHHACRQRADQLNVSRQTIDEVAGLTPGHASKLLASAPSRHLGPISLGLILRALGLKLVVVDDPEALAAVRDRLTPRNAKQVRYRRSVSLAAQSASGQS
jgi:hypothetical protein